MTGTLPRHDMATTTITTTITTTTTPVVRANATLRERRCPTIRIAPLFFGVAALFLVLNAALIFRLHHRKFSNLEERSPRVASASLSSKRWPTSSTSVVVATTGGISATRAETAPPSPVAPPVHIVFSTDCGGYQHWQGIALWYSAVEAGHAGPVTRIASGCDEDEKESIRAEWLRIDPTGRRFRVHFTPTFALGGRNDDDASTNTTMTKKTKGETYKYSNKPGGIQHWMMHATPPIVEDVICLIDPDMLLLRPVTPWLGYGLTERRRREEEGDDNGEGKELGLNRRRRKRRHGRKEQVEYVGSDGIARFLRVSGLPDLPPTIANGRPAGQHFGLGGAWASTPTNNRTGKAWANFSRADICGSGSPCASTRRKDADELYSVGPVYIATRDDWASISSRWVELMPRVHKHYPYLLAEMYAFTMSAADLKLPFSLLSSYMVSDPGTQSPTEAWSWIDDVVASSGVSAVCDGADSTHLPTSVATASMSPPLPTTLHYCQRYKFAGHLFAKRKMAHDFFNCEGNGLDFDTNAIIRELINEPTTGNIRTAFMLCNIIPRMNAALVKYKKAVCSK